MKIMMIKMKAVAAIVLLASSVVVAQDVELPPTISPFSSIKENFHYLDSADPFSVECVAKGEPEPQITWFKDGQEVVPSSSLTGLRLDDTILSFDNPSAARHTGYYHCEATNAHGKAKSAVIHMAESMPSFPEWAIAPEFVETPETEIIAVDATAEFRCKARGSPQPEIIWTRNGEVMEQFRGKEVLKMESVATQDIATYACNASNLAGYAYKMVYLNILNYRPIFLENPRNRTASIGMEIILRCSAKAYPLPTVSWAHNGTAIDPESEDISIDPRGDLTLKRVLSTSAGEYTCTVKNEKGEVSDSGFLTVVSTTTIEEGPNDMSAQVRSEVSMACTVLWDPSFKLNVEWQKDSVTIDTDDRFEFGAENQLIIRDLTFDDAGTYTCVASTSQGSTTDSGTLTVLGIPPTLRFGPSAQNVIEGSEILILCTVDGYPKPTHTWFNNSVRLRLDAPDADPRISIDEQGSLHIQNARLSDTSKYICRAENGYGEDYVGSAFIDIRRATKVIKGPEHQKFVMGRNYSLNCEVEVDPGLKDTLNITWIKDEETIDTEGNPRYKVTANGLQIMDITEQEIGTYSCAVRTPVDEVVISATIYNDQNDLLWLILLIVLICVLLILLCCCLICMVRKRSRETGKYGVKDIEDGKKRHNKSDIHYSIDDEGDSVHHDGEEEDDEMDSGDAKKPIFRPRDSGLIRDTTTKGSENSLLNLAEDDLWLGKGMDEDGSFREGRYAK